MCNDMYDLSNDSQHTNNTELAAKLVGFVPPPPPGGVRLVCFVLVHILFTFCVLLPLSLELMMTSSLLTLTLTLALTLHPGP